MKFLIEVLSLAVFFFLFREGVRRFMPKKQDIQSLSEDSLKALQRFRLRYFGLLFGFTLIFTLTFRYLFALLRSWWFNFLAQDYLALFPLEKFSIWLPALLLAFLISTLLAFSYNRKLQKDGLSFFLEEVQEEAQGYRSFGPKRWVQYGLGLVLFILLIVPLFRDSLRFEQAKIYQHRGLTEVKEFKRDAILGLEFNEGDHPEYYFLEEDTLSFEPYHYDTDFVKGYLDK